MIIGLNYFHLKFYIYIVHLLEVRVTVIELQIALSFGLVAAATRRYYRNMYCVWRPYCVQL